MREGEMATHLDFARKQKIISIAVPNNFDESVIANFMAGADLKDYVPSVKKFSVNQLLDELVEKTK